MDASKKNPVCDSRELYTPPCVVRINDLRQGEGQGGSYCESGSGDLVGCYTHGNNAGNFCANGNGFSGFN